MDIIILISFTLAAWLLHAGLASIYNRFMPITKSLKFRTVHVLEIGIVMASMLAAYRTFQDATLSTATTILTVLITLAIVDGIAFTILKQLRERFDIYHFIAAYSAIILATILAY
jgi:hypothetical protein